MENNVKSREKYFRMLSIYEKFCKDVVVNKKAEAELFHVNEKSIQRDIEDLRCYFAETHPEEEYFGIEFNREKNGYVMCHDHHSWLTSKEVMGIVKVLLESRGFTKDELDTLLDKLIMQCSPEQRHYIKEAVRNERYHYVPVKHGKNILDCLWELGRAVRERKMIQVEYQKLQQQGMIQRILRPMGIVFSEYYFYLVAYINDKEHEYPAIYRLDRIMKYTIRDENFTMPYANRFVEGEFRKRVQFMKTGVVIKLRFKYWGESLEAVLDRLPTAKIINQNGAVTTIEAEVFGRGIIMWLLSQAQFLEVLSPSEIREEMGQIIREMLGNYNS